ncbi:MAG: prepilin-type N-terminal cleavage/methylation domain-containing protein [Gammaproteobacteria bacterium]|nr:prepilin-type N-terminal cleavage/methylation domain-containing protein [Gammaproteobacteria bacterium]
MERLQRGFTLLELMIVVAIIGILAGVAVPQYKNYVIRADMAELISFTSAPKTALVEYYAVNSEMPTNASVGGFSEVSSATSVGSIWSLSYIHVDSDESKIRVIRRYYQDGAYNQGHGIDLLVHGASDGVWFECGSAGDGLGIALRQLPSTCRDF